MNRYLAYNSENSTNSIYKRQKVTIKIQFDPEAGTFLRGIEGMTLDCSRAVSPPSREKSTLSAVSGNFPKEKSDPSTAKRD